MNVVDCAKLPMKRKTQHCLCAYCGAPAETKDHIPPKCLFAKPKPSNLITVPSCQRCNLSDSGDDEYFRLMLSLKHDVYPHQDITKMWPRILDKLAKPQKTGLRLSVLSNIQPIAIYSPHKLRLGTVYAYDVDLSRLSHVAKRIFKGLYYHLRRTPLPQKYTVEAYAFNGFGHALPSVRACFENLVVISMRGKPSTIGNNVFSYWLRFCADDKNAFVGTLVFYEKVGFLGVCAKPNQ